MCELDGPTAGVCAHTVADGRRASSRAIPTGGERPERCRLGSPPDVSASVLVGEDKPEAASIPRSKASTTDELLKTEFVTALRGVARSGDVSASMI